MTGPQEGTVVQLSAYLEKRGAPPQCFSDQYSACSALSLDDIARFLRVAALNAKDRNYAPERLNALLWRLADRVHDLCKDASDLERKLRKAKKKARRR